MCGMGEGGQAKMQKTQELCVSHYGQNANAKTRYVISHLGQNANAKPGCGTHRSFASEQNQDAKTNAKSCKILHFGQNANAGNLAHLAFWSDAKAKCKKRCKMQTQKTHSFLHILAPC